MWLFKPSSDFAVSLKVPFNCVLVIGGNRNNFQFVHYDSYAAFFPDSMIVYFSRLVCVCLVRLVSGVARPFFTFGPIHAYSDSIILVQFFGPEFFLIDNYLLFISGPISFPQFFFGLKFYPSLILHSILALFN